MKKQQQSVNKSIQLFLCIILIPIHQLRVSVSTKNLFDVRAHFSPNLKTIYQTELIVVMYM